MLKASLKVHVPQKYHYLIIIIDGMLWKRTPKAEKSARQLFSVARMTKRRQQQANKENVAANTSQASSATMTLTDVQASMGIVSLPEHWQAFNADGVIQWSRMEIGHGGVLQPTASIVLNHNLSWSVHVHGKSASYLQALC